MRAFLPVLSCFCAVVLLAGCGIGNPGPMPSGYSSYNKPYKSASGKDADDVGYTYSNERNEDAQQQIEEIAEDLVEKLDQKLSFGMDHVYLSPARDSVFYKSFDHAMRIALVNRGYLLTADPDDAVRIDVVVQKLDKKSCSCAQSQGEDKRHLSLAMDVEKGVPADYVSGVYALSNAKDIALTRDIEIVPLPCAMSSMGSCNNDSCPAQHGAGGASQCARP